MSFMAKLIRQAAAGELNDDTKLYPSRKFTPQDIARIAERGATEFRSNDMNLISCFGPLEGEFGLYATLSNFVQTKGALTDEITEAVQDGDEVALTRTIMRALDYSFVALYEKKALARLQLVEDMPAEAMAEYHRMKRSIGPAPATNTTPGTAPAVAVAPAVVETPVETCVREFRETPSQAWKKKWLDNQNNRKVTDQAFAEGRL
jgi:hypothetical protein